AHGRDHGGDAECHVLQRLQPAFAARPFVIWHRHNAYVDLVQITNLARRSPVKAFHLRTVDAVRSVADYPDPDALLPLQRAQDVLEQSEVDDRGGASTPPHTDPLCYWPLADLVTLRVHSRRDN